MSEAEYWTEYDVIHNNKGKSEEEINAILNEYNIAKGENP